MSKIEEPENVRVDGKAPAAGDPPVERPARRQKKGDSAGRAGEQDSLAVLSQDARATFRGLKKRHLALFDAKPRECRQQTMKDASLVFGLKRGPKPDPEISAAGREVATGATIEDAFDRRNPGLKETNEHLHGLALESFRTKVNAFIRRHPRLKRLRDRRKARLNAPGKTA